MADAPEKSDLPQGFPLGAWQTNAYLLTTPQGLIVVDPGFEPEPLLARIRVLDRPVVAILLTHAHLDHIAGIRAVRAEAADATLFLHQAEQLFPGDPMLNLSAYLDQPLVAPEADTLLRGDAGTLEVGGTRLKWLHTPGHSPGGVTFYPDAPKPGWAIVGDTLFAGSVGRTDFPTSDAQALDASIRTLIEVLPGACAILPGHGPATVLDVERATNPFLRSAGGP